MRKIYIAIAGLAYLYIIFLYVINILDIYKIREGRFHGVISSTVNGCLMFLGGLVIGGFLLFSKEKWGKNTGIILIIINVLIDILFYGKSLV
ncbi:MAG: hypothetical protein JWR50_2614 [Mucilaginibacter sp.]|nr:hypothetical protein [Mucilaginibacter sp.]